MRIAGPNRERERERKILRKRERLSALRESPTDERGKRKLRRPEGNDEAGTKRRERDARTVRLLWEFVIAFSCTARGQGMRREGGFRVREIVYHEWKNISSPVREEEDYIFFLFGEINKMYNILFLSRRLSFSSYHVLYSKGTCLSFTKSIYREVFRCWSPASLDCSVLLALKRSRDNPLVRNSNTNCTGYNDPMKSRLRLRRVCVSINLVRGINHQPYEWPLVGLN